MMLQALQAATALTLAGYAVLPTSPRSREIHIPGWSELRLGIDELPQHFSRAELNVSINWKTSSGRCALDLDVVEAEELAPLLLAHDTPAFGRAGRLRQVVYECPEAANLSLKYGGEMLVEVRAGGTASLAPGSTQPDGDQVAWCAGRDPESCVPKKITKAILQLTAHVVAGAALLLRYWRSIAGQGMRHDTALQLAGAMLHGGWSDTAVRGVLRAVFQVAGDPELQDRTAGIEGTIKRRESGQPFSGLPELAKSLPPELTAALVKFWGLGGTMPEISSPPTVSSAVPALMQDEVLLTWACDVAEEKVEWHWYGILAAGKTTVFGGDPGCGKSTIAASVAAAYSTGAPFPGDSKRRSPMGVLLAAAEDGASDTKRPRLVAAGADLSKVAFMDLVQTGTRQRYFTLADIPALHALLSKHPGKFGLLVIDPIGAYLGGCDSHRDADVRELLRPLGDLAEQHRIAVLLIAHLNKGRMQSAMDRITGAKAFVGAPRLAWLVAKDPNDQNTVLVLQMKTNLTGALDGLSYRVVNERLPSGAEASKIIWNDLPVKLTADEALQRPPKKGSGQEQAEVWLQQRLGQGPVAVRVLKEESDLVGCSWDTIKRAAKELHVQGEGEMKDRVWMLPGHGSGVVVQVDFGSPRNAPTKPPTEDEPA